MANWEVSHKHQNLLTETNKKIDDLVLNKLDAIEEDNYIRGIRRNLKNSNLEQDSLLYKGITTSLNEIDDTIKEIREYIEVYKKENKIEAIRLDDIATTKNELLYEAQLSINNNEVEGDE